MTSLADSAAPVRPAEAQAGATPATLEGTYAPSGVTRGEFVAARKGRNVAIALSLIGFAVLLYAVTLVKLGPGAIARPF